MKNPQEASKAFSGLLKKITKRAADRGTEDDAVETLVKSFLMWESTTAKAEAAYKRITDRIVDFNDLRVSMPHEIVEWIGPRYPNAAERALRLRAALRHTYNREHAISLDRLHGMARREVKQYLRTLDGVPPYVADRVTLLCFDAHCVPVDERLHESLAGAGVCDEDIDVSELSSWLARHVKAADAVATHHALQAWSDRAAGGTTRRKRGGRKKVAR